MRHIILGLILILTLAACDATGSSVADAPATATLAPILSQTPRLTATPVPTRTPIPTFTFTPSDTPTPSETAPPPTPTEIPPIVGIVTSLQRVNVRQGPDISFRDFAALDPGTSVEVLGQSGDGRWLNIKMEDGQEGWMSARLIQLVDTPTPLPTLTPTSDLTAIALGTELPTAVVGGGTVTATAPIAVISPTPLLETARPNESATPAPTSTLTTTPRTRSLDATPLVATFTRTPTITPTSPLIADEALVPIVDIEALNATATALAGPSDTPTASPTAERNTNIIITPDNDDDIAPSVTPAPGEPAVQSGVDVLAYCDDPTFNAPPPNNLAEGTTVDIYWVWYASTEGYIQDHLDAATYEITFDGSPLTNLRQYRQPVSQLGTDYAVYWYAPVGPLPEGEYEISYRVTWDEQIFDGYDNYGPGTPNLVEEGTCTFQVQAAS